MTDDYAGLNRCLICKGPSGGQLCEICTEQNRGGGDDRGDSALAWWLTLKTMPYLTLAGSAIALASFITVHAAGYRTVLETFLPGSWIAAEAGGDGKPSSVVFAVGAVLALGVVGLTLLRRVGTQRWEADEASRSTFFAWCAGVTFLRTLLLVAAFGLLGGAAGIAAAKDIENPETGGFPGSFPWIVTFVTVAWFSFRSTRRTIRKSTTRKLADWWQGIDGAWYPPLVPAGTYDAASMRWLATDGLWYPSPADWSGPAGTDTGWWLASDDVWYPPQLGATS